MNDSAFRERLTLLSDRLRAATGPDRELDLDLHIVLGFADAGAGTWGPHLRRIGRRNVDEYTGSIDAAVTLIKRVLPGWIWQTCECSVSDDAWICPDLNHPEHGARLRAELGNFDAGSIWDTGFDVDRRPAGNPPLALLEALIAALLALTEAKEEADA